MSSELELRLQRSIALFKQKNYADALTEYTELIQTVNEIPIPQIKKLRVSLYNLLETPVFGPVVHPRIGTLLDGRAATLEKLGQYDLALQSATKITTLEPLSCKGYIRVGKILQLLERKEEAYKVYQKGLYLIKRAQKRYGIAVPESLYGLLKENYKHLNSQLLKRFRGNNNNSDSAIIKAQQLSTAGLQRKFDQLVPLKRSASSGSGFDLKRSHHSSNVVLDPFEYLPFELLDFIFSLLPMAHVLRCRTVSRRWCTLIDNLPHLFEFKCRSSISLQQFQAGVQFQRRITRLTKYGKIKSMSLKLDTKDTKILDYALESFAFKLESLLVQNSRWNLLLILNRITKESKKLFFVNLESLLLTIGLPLKCLAFLAAIAPQLKQLTIVSTDNNYNVKSLNLNPIIGNADPNNKFKALEAAKLIFLPRENLPPLKDQQTLQCLGHNLHSFTLVCQHWDNPSGPWFMDWLGSNSNLKQLYLEGNGIAISTLFETLSRSSIVLDSFVAREGVPSSDNSLGNLSPQVQFPFLFNVRYLDFYGILATFRFQERLLQILSSTQGYVETLNLGKLGLCFEGYLPDTRSGLGLRDILRLCPNLKHLFLNELLLDNHSLLLFNKAFHSLGRSHLQTLDLSFCTSITGTGLIRLFDETNNFRLTIDKLILDGVLVDPATLGYLVRSGYIAKIQNDPIARRWDVFGIRSLIRHKT
ncbi:uncharacterized protein KQ657_004998 [Scheffersomyces spartinae]|uniref:F-box domain-containing protein n=1 Tax=Scheffersomyces spartinae TaxID=45513 RepID=A0A9P7VB10_9ASCO|nr:uncharacterized protein KQ657_004998 [Scheffersomyces spartinae]KAG7194271.1 hypothetical protein KQ657_004998 [Scheffersomyces spartinae]